MSSFTTDLDVRFIDGKKWKVIAPFRYRVGSRYSDEIIDVEAGSITNFASIPRLFWIIVGHPAGKYGKAAVIHDELYSNHIYSRKRSDQIFYEAMGVSKVSLWKRKVIYRTVRMFGMFAWKRGGKKK